MSDTQFVCPECKSTHWGTSMPAGVNVEDEWVGHCHGWGCSFKWQRRDDDKVFVSVPCDDVVEPLTKREEILVRVLRDIANRQGVGHPCTYAQQALEELFHEGNLHSARASGVGL